MIEGLEQTACASPFPYKQKQRLLRVGTEKILFNV